MDHLKRGDQEDEEARGFPDMNYLVGNTSGLDVGNIPTAIDQRIGDQSTLGGSVMEVQIYNPSTFKVEKEEILNTINQLDIDISLHSEPGIGYASGYKTRGQQAQGYETVHGYFTRYLNQAAIFKREKENREELDFEITRINPHISTSPMPALQERMASDVGLDIFGYTISDLDESTRHQKNQESRNIYANKKFLRRMYYTFMKKRTVDQVYQLYSSFFSRYSNKFDRIFRDAQRQACDEFYDRGLSGQSDEDKLETKVALVSTAGRQDVGVESAWLDLLEKEFEDPINIEDEPASDPQTGIGKDELENLNDIDEIIPRAARLTSLPRLSEAIYRIENEEFVFELGGQRNAAIEDDEKAEKVKDQALEAINNRLDKLWRGNGDKFLISVQGKIGALQNHLDIDQQRIVDMATDKEAVDFEEDDGQMWDLDEAAEEVIVGNSDFFRDIEDKREDERYDEMIRFILNNFEQQMWMESNLFYFLLPAWMVSADYSNSNHRGWKAPKFIWKNLIESKWGEKYDIDLKDPAKENGYFEALENDERFREDVCGAAGACYVWGHFTQKKSQFEISDEEYVEEDVGSYTWIDWMNKYGIGVNFESMDGDPQQPLKVWKPRHIVTAARAINITARKRASNGNLGGMDKINPELDECPAKFTIDMEHTASFGVNPWKEMKDLINQERKLAEDNPYGAIVDSDKPLAKMLRNYHLTKPGLESQRGSRHGPFDRGDKTLYTWLFHLVEAGYARNPDEVATLMYEQGEEKAETTYMARIAMDLIELGVPPEEVDPVNVSTDGDYESKEEALIAKFFGIDESSTAAEWAKIEQHAFDPLQGLLEAEEFDYTYSSAAAIRNDLNPREWPNEEYQ